MPKLKTKKSISKRFKLTKSGKIKRSRGGKGHLLTSKKESRKRSLRRSGLVSKPQSKMIKQALLIRG